MPFAFLRLVASVLLDLRPGHTPLVFSLVYSEGSSGSSQPGAITLQYLLEEPDVWVQSLSDSQQKECGHDIHLKSFSQEDWKGQMLGAW